MFTRSGPRNNMIWSRTEYAFKTDDVHSSMSLYDLDCVNGKHRIVQIIVYSDTNLRGQSYSRNTPSQWTYPAPGTLGESVFRRGCGLE